MPTNMERLKWVWAHSLHAAAVGERDGARLGGEFVATVATEVTPNAPTEANPTAGTVRCATLGGPNAYRQAVGSKRAPG
jgi:hypothetical protein